jgi:hypothetical protein
MMKLCGRPIKPTSTRCPSAWSLTSADAPLIDAEFSGGGNHVLELTNVGTEPTKVLEVMINERLDCSTINQSTLSYNHGIKEMYSLEDRHKFWVSGFEVNDKTKKVMAKPPRELNIGDGADWYANCNIVRVTSTTDKGRGFLLSSGVGTIPTC